MPQLPLHDAGRSCNLDEAGAARRNAEFADVVERGLRGRSRTSEGSVRLVFENKEGMESDIRGLAERESQCCGFFSFDIDVGEDAVVLKVRAPADKAEYLDMLYEATDPDRPTWRHDRARQ